MRMRIVISSFIAIFCTYVCYGEVTVNELLDRYDQNQSSLTKILIESRTVELYEDSLVNDPLRARTESKLIIDGERLDLSMIQWPNLENEKDRPEVERAGKQRVIWDGKKWYEQKVGRGPEHGNVFIVDDKTIKDGYFAKGYWGASLCGIYRGDFKKVSSLLREAEDNITINKISVDGHERYVLEAKIESGKYKIYFDPEHGYNICRAEISKQGDDRYYNNTLSKPPPDYKKLGMDVDNFTPPLPTSPRKELLFTLKNVNFRKFGEVWIPVEADWETKTTRQNGRVVCESFHHQRTHVDLSPDFKAIKAFVPDIPNGTMVYGPVGSHVIHFKWLDGEIVPKIDDVAIAEVEEIVEQLTGDTERPEEPKNNQDSSPRNIAEAKEKTPLSSYKYISQTSSESHGSILVWILVPALILGIGVGVVVLKGYKGEKV